MAESPDKFSRLAALRPSRSTSRPTTRRAPEEEDFLSRILGVTIATNHCGEHVSVRCWFPTPESVRPSQATLDLLLRTRKEPLSKRATSALSNPEEWLFLDTETTGLSGGTGTYAFLIGLAWWDAGGLQIEQLFMRDFAEEHSILHELASRLAERPVLITFNGKSFDWPLLENRFTMTRSIPTPRLAAHLDLLHPARALWKLRLGSVRLVDLERHVLDAPKLGWHREDDVLSALIPQHYFDYLRGGPAGPLACVVRHNQMDLRGLAALVGKMDSLLAGAGELAGDIDSLDLFGLSRFLQRRGVSDRAHAACAQALDLGLPVAFRPQAKRDLALLAKRRGDHDDAAALWHEVAEQLAAEDGDFIHACKQLAIYYERRRNNFERAAEFAKLALARLRRLRSRERYPTVRGGRTEQNFLNRIARLEHRIKLSENVLPLLRTRPARSATAEKSSA